MAIRQRPMISCTVYSTEGSRIMLGSPHLLGMVIVPAVEVHEIRCPSIRIWSEPVASPKENVILIPGRRPSRTARTPSRLRESAPTLAD